MTLDEIRAILANPEAWRPVGVSTDRASYLEAVASYCDDRARTIAQALAGEQAALDSVKARRGQR